MVARTGYRIRRNAEGTEKSFRLSQINWPVNTSFHFVLMLNDMGNFVRSLVGAARGTSAAPGLPRARPSPWGGDCGMLEAEGP